jgi:hypothetical protein
MGGVSAPASVRPTVHPRPGQVGRYRANYRFTGCGCNPSWFYETWVVHVSNGCVNTDRFIQGRPDRDVDDRVHLYG